MAEQGMKNIEKLYERKIFKRLKKIRSECVCPAPVPITDVSVAETQEHIPVREAARLRFRPVKAGFRWGKPWSTAWFRLRFIIPREMSGRPVVFNFKTGGECIVFRNGHIVQALDRGRDELILGKGFKAGERIELLVEAGASSDFGHFEPRTMQAPWIAARLDEVWEAYWDGQALADLLAQLPDTDTFRARIVYELARALDVFDYGNPSPGERVAAARAFRRAVRPLYACQAHDSAQVMACIGHAHIDVAWLWPLAETRRKCGRTFSNALALMEDYPEYRFLQSQPQLYEYTRQQYPEIFARIRRMIRKGQWIADGAAWVEMDCNITGAESLVRQILVGTRFFRDELGVESSCLWLPDVFGYSAALPQILRRSGIPYFLTQKISWNSFSVFPYHSFWWEGIDGTPLLTHFPPVNTYNAKVSADELVPAAGRYREKARSGIQAVPYGYGDGGGGPTRDMLERIRRYRNLEGSPRTVPMSAREFFGQLEKSSDRLPHWVGELYLELHRGTYTTQARNKALNRESEIELRQCEMLSAIAMARGSRYPQDLLTEAWKIVLLNQFHDIIPGSSIGRVYEESREQYASVLTGLAGIKRAALDCVAAGIETRGGGIPVLGINTLSWERKDTVAVELKGLRNGAACEAVLPGGGTVPAQVGWDGKTRFVASIPSVGYSVFHVRKAVEKAAGPDVMVTTSRLENEHLVVTLDGQGRVRRILDKDNARDVLAPGGIGNQFVLTEDKPAAWDAWDVDLFHLEKPLAFDGELTAVRVVEKGRVRGVVRIERRLSHSRIRQDIVLTAGSRRIDFETTVDWGNEKDVFLRVLFPVNVLADKARYEIQFGNVERPTHWNRPSDIGMFEVPAQKWADLSEGDYGVALLNNCKYGYSTKGNVMALSLLRAPTHPDPKADVGQTHRFTYSLLPHAGNYIGGGVVREGYELNIPVEAQAPEARKGSLPMVASWLGVSNPNVIIESVKKAEDDAGIIVRLYEAHGCRGRTALQTTLPVRRAVETDLMEREENALKVKAGRVALAFKPFQIRTVKLVWK